MATLAAPLRAGAGSDAASSSSFFSIPDITVFSVLARRALTDALDRIAGAKTLVLDAKIAGTLGLIAEMSLLREHGVEQIYWLDPGALSQAQKHIVYVCRPELSLMRTIADQIKSASPAINHTYTILMTPRASIVCTDMLEELGALGSVDIQEFPMSLIPVERDVLSMELPCGAYRKIFLDSLYDPIYEMARSLLTLQRIFGLIPRVLGKGDAAKRLFEIMSRLRKEDPITSSSSSSGLAGYGQFDSMIIIDRQVDMITPLCTQLTYEGLVDEIIGIKNASVEVDAAVTNPVPPTPSSSTATHFGAQQPPKKKRHLLSTLNTAASANSGPAATAHASSDNLFSDLRDRNFTVVGSILNRTAKRINADYEGRHQAQTVREMRDFVGKLSGLQAEHQALRLHTSLTEEIMRTTSTDAFNRALEIQQNILAGVELAAQETAIRNLIDTEANFPTVMRLLCLYSLAANGIKPKIFEDIKRDILHSYGFEYLPLLIYLSDLGLLRQSTGTSSSSNRSALAAVRKPLRLIVDDIDEANPEDIAYVYSGYAPISVRLVQHAIGLSSSSYSASNLMAGIPGVGSGISSRDRTGNAVVGWKGLDEVMRTLPGAVFDEVQKPQESEQSRSAYTSDQIPVTLVCFIGGCTYTELSALRFTSQRLSNRKIVVATTGMLNGSSLIESLGPRRR